MLDDPNLLTPKDSSNIKSARLDAATGVVEVHFANGSHYRYANFTAAQLTEWRGAKSAGSWFHTNVRSHPDAHPVVADGAEPPARVEIAQVETPAATPAPDAPKMHTPAPARAYAPAAAAVEAPAPHTAKRAKQWWKDRPWRNGPNGAELPARPMATPPTSKK